MMPDESTFGQSLERHRTYEGVVRDGTGQDKQAMRVARSGINGKILEAVHGEVYLSSSQCFLKSSREESLVSRGIKGEMLELVPLSLDDLSSI